MTGEAILSEDRTDAGLEELDSIRAGLG